MYTIVAPGLTMMFRTLRIVTFAHGDFLMLDMYLTCMGAAYLRLDPYISPLFVLPLVTWAGFAYCVLIQPLGAAGHTRWW